jgi:hypothetical protein
MKNYLIISAVVLALVMAGPAQILAQTTIGATVPVARATFFSQLESFINNVVKFVYDLQTKSVVVVSTGGSNTPAPSAPSTPLVAMVGAVDTGDRVTDHPLAPITMYCKGDMNHDGVVNNFDIDGFTATLQANNSGDYWSNFPQTWYADVAGGKDGEGDQVLNDTDNDTFLDMVLNHPVLHCVPELPEAPKPPIAGEPARFCKGDMNHDGRVNNFDLDGFTALWDSPTRSDYWANFSQSWYADINNSLTITDEDNAMFRHLVIDQATPECVDALPERPVSQCSLLGDANHDGVVNNFDIDPFVAALDSKMEAGDSNFATIDVDRNGELNNADADLFTNMVLGYAPVACI